MPFAPRGPSAAEASAFAMANPQLAPAADVGPVSPWVTYGGPAFSTIGNATPETNSPWAAHANRPAAPAPAAGPQKPGILSSILNLFSGIF